MRKMLFVSIFTFLFLLISSSVSLVLKLYEPLGLEAVIIIVCAVLDGDLELDGDFEIGVDVLSEIIEGTADFKSNRNRK